MPKVRERAGQLEAGDQAATTNAVRDEIRRKAEELVAALPVEERRNAVGGSVHEQRALQDVPRAG
jgi:hypothetical protein